MRLPSAACAAIVEQARAEGWTPPGDGELMSAGEEAAPMAKLEKTAIREGSAASLRTSKTGETSKTGNGPVMFWHDDWTMFRNLGTLGQKADAA